MAFTPCGFENIKEAIPLITEQHKDIEFSIAGGGTLLSEVRTIIEKYGNTKVSIHNWIPHDETPAYLNELDLLVVPSYAEDLPSVMLEAMSCGVPSIVTKIGGNNELIKDMINGILVEPDNTDELASAILKLIKNPDLQTQISIQARKDIEGTYDIKNISQRYINMYKEN